MKSSRDPRGWQFWWQFGGPRGTLADTYPQFRDLYGLPNPAAGSRRVVGSSPTGGARRAPTSSFEVRGPFGSVAVTRSVPNARLPSVSWFRRPSARYASPTAHNRPRKTLAVMLGSACGERLATVLATVYLIFNRLGRALVQLLPERPEPHGLLALMLLHDARRDARTRDGELVLLADQDRSLWDAAQLTAGPRLSAARPGTRRPWAVRAAAGHRRSAHQAEHPSGVPSRSGPWTLSATRGRHGRWLIDEQGHGDVSKDKGTSCNRSRSQQPTS